MLTSNPQSIAAITATIDFDMPVSKKKEMITDKQSVRNGFLNKNIFIFLIKRKNEKTKEMYEIIPRVMPLSIFLPPSS